MHVYFAPYQNCEEKIIDALNNAQKNVYMQASILSSTGIKNALKSAQSRIGNVTILWDEAISKGKDAQNFAEMQGAGISVDISKSPVAGRGIAHNKIIIIDEETVITGSYNFSNGNSLGQNAENLLVIKSKSIAQQYLDNLKKDAPSGVLFNADIQDSGELSSTYAMRIDGVTGVDLLAVNEGIYKTNTPIYSKITRLKDNEMSGYFMLNTGCFWLGYNHYSQAIKNHSEKSAVTCFKIGDNFLETQIGTVDNTYFGNRYMLTFGRDFQGGFSTFMQFQHRNLADQKNSLNRIERGLYIGASVEKDVQLSIAKAYIEASFKTGVKSKNVGNLNSFKADNQLMLSSNTAAESISLNFCLSLTNLQKSSATMEIGLEL